MNRAKLGCVYSIICLSNNKIYIGQTVDFKRRIWEHLHSLQLNKHKNHYMQQDFNTYGVNCFKFNIIADNLNLETRRNTETYYIQKYGGIESTNVYNYQDNITENTEMRHLVSTHQKGKIISPTAIEKMRNTLTGRKLSEEHKQHIKQSCARFCGDNNPAKRKEVRAKISQKVSGKNNGMYGKRKYNQDFILTLREDYITLKSYRAVADKYNISVTTIANLIKFGETYNPSTYLAKRKFND